MRIKTNNGVEMVELNSVELASLDARLRSLDSGECQTCTDAELDQKWRVDEPEHEQDDQRRAA